MNIKTLVYSVPIAIIVMCTSGCTTQVDNYFEVDYERMFRKSFMPVIESMFKIKGWIKDKEKIEIESSGLDDFFV